MITIYILYNTYRIYEHHTQQYRTSSKKVMEFISNMFPEKLRHQLFNSNMNLKNHNNNSNIPLLMLPSSLSDSDDEWRVHHTTKKNHNTKTPTTSTVSAVEYVNDDDVEVGNGTCTTTTLSMCPSDEITTTDMSTDTTLNKPNSNNNSNNHTATTTPSTTSCTSSSSSSSFCSGPIVELYPATTIMIADLAGFTAWSAYQEPMHVFLILETIFYNFDQIALQNKSIYKIETVGDCYVAVAGIPDPCIDHAIIMAQFAKDCITKFNAMIQELDTSFTSTTTTTKTTSSSLSSSKDDEPIPRIRDLGIRIGLNSGPITGGILRGERNRFQLFGDTINTGTYFVRSSFSLLFQQYE
jgi:hypothetical protein